MRSNDHNVCRYDAITSDLETQTQELLEMAKRIQAALATVQVAQSDAPAASESETPDVASPDIEIKETPAGAGLALGELRRLIDQACETIEQLKVKTADVVKKRSKKKPQRKSKRGKKRKRR